MLSQQLFWSKFNHLKKRKVFCNLDIIIHLDISSHLVFVIFYYRINMPGEPSLHNMESSNTENDTNSTDVPTNDVVGKIEHAEVLAAELKRKLEIFIDKYQSICGDKNEEMAHLKEICALIEDRTGTLYKALGHVNEPEAEFYEAILQAAFDLNIHTIMFEKLKSCCVLSPVTSGDKYLHQGQHVDIVSSDCETLEVCLETLALLASGNLPQGRAVRETGLTPYAEAFALQEMSDKASCCAYKLLTAFMYDDSDIYGRSICQQAKYHRRANSIFRHEKVSICAKGWLVDFFSCTLYHRYFFVRVRYYDWQICMCLSAGCYLLQQNDILHKKKALQLLKHAFSHFRCESSEDRHNRALRECLFSLSESLISVLISRLLCPDSYVVTTSLLVLLEVMHREQDFYSRDSNSFVQCTVSNGFFFHALALFRTQKTAIIETVLLVLEHILQNEDLETHEPLMLRLIVSYLSAFLRSMDFYVAVRAMSCVSAILNNIEYDECKQFICDFVHENSGIIHSLLVCLSNAQVLMKNRVEKDEGYVEHIEKVVDRGLDCLEYLIKIGLEGAKNVALVLSDVNSMQLLERFKEACSGLKKRKRGCVESQLESLNQLFDAYDIDAYFDSNIECDEESEVDRGDNPYGRYFDGLDYNSENNSDDNDNSDNADDTNDNSDNNDDDSGNADDNNNSDNSDDNDDDSE